MHIYTIKKNKIKHYKPYPCDTVGVSSEYVTDKRKVTCMHCINRMIQHDKLPKLRIIGETIVGSTVWSMNTRYSDVDIFRVYAEKPENVLIGKKDYFPGFIQVDDKDIATHEAQKAVEELLRGNINFLVGVLSPNVVNALVEFEELRIIVKKNLAKNCYSSIHDMAQRNYLKYIISGKDDSTKKCNQIVRFINFGINLLLNHEIDFKPCQNSEPDDILEKISELNWAYEISTLPDKPDEKPFRDWLLKLRLDDLKINKRSPLDALFG